MKRRFANILASTFLPLMAMSGYPEPPRREDTKVYSQPFDSRVHGIGQLSVSKKVRKGAGRRLSRAQRKKLNYKKQLQSNCNR